MRTRESSRTVPGLTSILKKSYFERREMLWKSGKGGMSSPYSGESASPYSDGVPSPPTVVAAYNRPYEVVHYDGPYIQILKQPQSKFRFRYKSEMVGTHGQLKADCSDKNKAAFPTVKLAKWNSGPAVIRLMLYTAEENVNQRKRHVHELSGKNCDKETGICEVVVDEKCDYTAQFQNLGIIHIAKRDTREIIMRRKREELVAHLRLRKPQHSVEEICRSITQADLKRIDEEADEEAKSMDLNKVTLRFQAYQYDKNIERYRPITLPVDSDIVYNLKNATTGELKIVRMSACSAPCTGGTEIWLLVEKVRRNNVQVKFFELDNNDREVWTAYGEFSDSDVHHQYAIVFRTPRYRFTNLNTAVRVKVQLERPTDRDTSEPLDFTYMPDSLKRSRIHLETALEEGKGSYNDPPSKRFNFNPYDSQAIDLSNNKCNGRGQEDSMPTPDILEFLAGELGGNANFNIEGQNQSPQHMVPSPVNSIDSSSQGLYSPMHPGSTGTPNTEYITLGNSQLQVPSPVHQMSTSPQYGMMSPGDNSVGSPPYQGGADNGGGMTPQFTDSQYNSPSPGMMVPSPSYQENTIQVVNQQYIQQQQVQQHQQLQLQQHQQQQQNQQIQKQDMGFQHLIQGTGDTVLVQQQTLSMQPSQQVIQDFNLPDCFSLGSLGQESLLDMLEVASEQLEYGANELPGSNLKADYGGKSNTKKKEKDQPLSSGQDVDEITKLVSGVRIDDSREQRRTQRDSGNRQTSPSVDVAFKVAINAAECLQAYAATGDISLLLATHRYLLAVQNNQGDTALHTAVSNKNVDAFNKILKACEKIKPTDLLNAQNFSLETALHQAVSGNELTMVRRLVAVPGCDVSIPDARGNTPLHRAAQLQDHSCLEALLTRPINGARSAVSQAINAYNYQGETPLHLAVISGNLNIVRILINAGAQVHMCEHKRGANPLHLCAMYGHHRIAEYLIRNTSITVEAGLFDGNTALHLAAQARDPEMCRVLMRANADPEAKNYLRRRKKVSESEEEEEEEESPKKDEDEEEEESEEEAECYTPLDYAGDDREILEILRREVPDEPSVPEVANEVQEVTKLPNAQFGGDSGIDISVSGIDISVSDISSPDSSKDSENSVGHLSAGIRRSLANHLSGDTWRHLAQLLDLDYLVPHLSREASPASLLLQPDNMKGVTIEKLRGCLEVLGLKDCLAVLDAA
ncbi:nuclear factor NF-kappa-B p105 subunit-like isoform X4 [Macrobrachium rosenbergii]|uniref:nuclear factor NF-kappa-B p105 subunit-like isoform X4 n=2 Tax=Macrobrachium rosenbergii TaxID=79674 RepID=UPI0034D60B2A